MTNKFVIYSKNLKENFLFYLSIYTSFILIYLNYDIVYSPDFEKYFNYLRFYSGDVDSSNLEQGNLYFFFIYLLTIVLNVFINEISNFQLLNISVLLGNYIIYIFALIGLKRYLLLNNFDEKKVYLSLIILNFSPPTLILRMTFKPEILAFTLIIWSLFYFQLFNFQKNQTFLNFFLFFSVIISTLKVSVFLMYIILILFKINLRKFLFDIKPFYKNIVLFVLVLLSLHIENYVLNDKPIYEVTHDQKYNNSADLEFFTNFNSNELNDNPHKNFHNNSFIAITLLDTFSDYFELYWNSDHTNFNSSRKQFIEFNESTINKQPYQLPVIKYDKNLRIITYTGNINSRYIAEDVGENVLDEIRMRGGFFFTVAFYFFALIFSIKYKNLRVLILSPLIGITLIGLSSLGLFLTKNYDPLAGDSVKTYYYSFFTGISFVIVLNIFLKFVKKYDKALTILLVVFFTFLIGLPTSFNEDVINEKNEKNNYLITCEINQIFIEFDHILNFQNCNKENRRISDFTEFSSLNFKLRIKNIPYFSILSGVFFAIHYYYFRKKQV